MDYQNITAPRGTRIAYHFDKRSSDLPPVVFLCGFRSNMDGGKSVFLDEYCRVNHRTYLRFDYFAHGASEGDFLDFTIGKAVEDAVFMIETFIDRPAIIVGSSMGGWVGLRLIELMPEKIHGFIGIAAAPDFSAEIAEKLTEDHKRLLAEQGYFTEPSGYEDPYIFTNEFFTDGATHCMLHKTIKTDIPVHLLQGKQDTAVPWEKAERIKTMLNGHAAITYIDDGDHSLSRPQDLDILKSAIEGLDKIHA